MRKFFSAVVMTGVLSLVASGCALSTSEDASSQHQFTRDSSGKVVQTNASSLDNFTPTQSFERSLSSKGEQAATPTEIDPQVDSCGGACTRDVCVCVGDLDCCIIGCTICMG
ncbi:MAG TPA: hypothetical protein VF469_05555 [Kofleriaceae bacterium]